MRGARVTLTGLLLVAAAVRFGLPVSVAAASIPDTPDGALASVRNPAGAGAGTEAAVADVAISGSGRYVVFDSTATNLYTGQATHDTNGTCDVFRRDLYTGTTILVSRVSASGNAGNGCSSHPAIDYDGNEVAFLTTATNLGASNSSTAAAVVSNISADTLTTASMSNGSSPMPASDSVGAVAISGDGNTVAFTSSSNLVNGVTTGGVVQVWARNLSASPQTTTLISSANGSSTEPASSAAGSPSVDEYGANIAFTSSAALTSTATGSVKQVYVRNLSGSTTTLASRATGASGAAANAAATAPSLSAIGNAVGFLSSATNLGDATGQTDDYVRSLSADTTTLANTAANGTTVSNAAAGPPSLSAYGNIVAFASAATNLGVASGGHQQIWVHDLTRATVTLASPATGSSSAANGDSTVASLSQGGIDVAYQSAASNLEAGDTDTTVDAYLYRVRVAIPQAVNTTSVITRDGLDGRTSSNQPSGDAGQPTQFAVSGNDLYVAFELLNAPLTGEFTPTVRSGVYVRNLQTGEVELVSRATDAGGFPGTPLGACGSGEDSYAAISADGRYVAFAANAEDGHNCQIWLRDRQSGTTTLESVSTGGTVSDADSFYPALSSNGRYLLFASRADNLAAHHPAVGANPGPGIDLYERDLQSGTTTIVSLPDGAAPAGTTFATGASGFDDQSSVSDDGRYVAFVSRDAQLEAGSPYGSGQQLMSYLRDMQTNRTYALQHEPGGGGTWGDSGSFSRSAKISADGSTLTFDSDSANLVPGHTSTQQDIYYRAVTFDSSGNLDSPIHIASVPTGAEPGAGGTFGNSSAEFPAVGSDGRLIAFVSAATNYGTTVATPEVWVRDTQAATTTLVSRLSGTSGLPANGGGTVFAPGMSADGTVVAFESSAPNLNPDGDEQELGYVRFVPAPPTPPIAGTPTITGDLHDGGTPTCNTGSWTGNPMFSYQWLRGSAKTPIAGATSASYKIADADVTSGQLYCQVTGTVSGAPSVAATSVAVTPLPDPPVNQTLPQVKNADAAGDTATCDPGTWTATPPAYAPTSSNFKYQWFVGNSPVSGATGSTFFITPADGGQPLGCEVFATNTGGTTTAASPGVTPIPPAPVNVVKPLLSFTAPALNGTLVTCNPGQWEYNPTSISVTWSRNGLTIPGATGRTYLLGTADVHATVNCSEFARNAGGMTAVDSSNTTGIVRQTAAVPLVAPKPVEPALGQRACQAGKFSYATPVSFTWYRNGISVGPGDQAGTAGPGQIYHLTDADLGKSLSCLETSTNSDGFSSSARSGSIQIPTSKCTIASYFFSQQGPPASDDLVYNSPYSHDGTPVLGSYSPGETACLGYQDPKAPASSAPPLPKPIAVVVSGGIVGLKIHCLGKSGSCQSTLTLTTTQLVEHLLVDSSRAASAKAAKPIRIATTHYKVKAGKAVRVRLRLSGKGLKLLAREHKLSCTLIVRPRGGKSRVFEYMSLRPAKRSRGA